MSKIEDALNKAKSKQLSVIGEKVDSNAKELVKADVTGIDTIQHKTSASEIGLMEHGDLLETTALSNMKIISSKMHDNTVANTYRDLRTKLIQKCQGKNFVAMLTSTVDGDSSCFTTVNLATAFAFDESKTSLIIDSNISNPQFEHCLEHRYEFGLTDYLENDDISAQDVIQPTGIQRLKAIPAGQPREVAHEYFTSLRMRSLVSDLIGRYSDRYIFINSAPISESADSRILCELCDFVILVVPYGSSSQNKISEAVESIGEDKFAGIVFSDVPRVPSFRKRTKN